jgi:TolB-like protein
VPRVGYRLPRDTAPATEAARDKPALPSARPSIAVLPFVNLSPDPEQEFLADGLVEDLITALSRFHTFAVVSRTSSFVYKGRAVDAREAASDLGVRYLLEAACVGRATG